MPTDAKKPTSRSKMPTQTPAFLVLGTIADTTWRMFTPPLLGIGVGLYYDHATGSAPLGILVGVVLGFIVSIGLVALQLRKPS